MNQKMRKLIYTGVFATLALGFVACSEAEEEINDLENDIKMSVEEEISEEKTAELDKTIELQEKAETLEDDIIKFHESL